MEKKSFRHIISILIPVLLASLYLFTASVKIKNSSYSATSDLFLRYLPYILIGLTIIVVFFVIRSLLSLKISLILTIILTLIFSLLNIFTTPNDRLKDVLESLHAPSPASDPIIVPDETLFAETKTYDTPVHPVLSAPPDDAESFWYLSYLPDSAPTSPYDGYDITNEISTPDYLALRLVKSPSETTP